MPSALYSTGRIGMNYFLLLNRGRPIASRLNHSRSLFEGRTSSFNCVNTLLELHVCFAWVPFLKKLTVLSCLLRSSEGKGLHFTCLPSLLETIFHRATISFRSRYVTIIVREKLGTFAVALVFFCYDIINCLVKN